MEFEKTATVNSSADKVWNIVGNNFNEISAWASPVLDSHANPDVPEGGGRICNVKGAGQVVETIYHYDDQARELGFILEGEKIPFFMKKIDSQWSVKPAGDDQSEVTVRAKVTLMPVFSQLMSGMLRNQMGKQAQGIIDDLKYYVENGHAKN
ncbi:MAG: SRPBCC family protein [Chloroflexota bacterium]